MRELSGHDATVLGKTSRLRGAWLSLACSNALSGAVQLGEELLACLVEMLAEASSFVGLGGAAEQAHRDDLGDVMMLEQLAQLPLAQRQMLVLRYVLGYSVPQTAEALGVAEGTVKSGVHRARQQRQADVEVSDGTR